jgi:hypothetical protein
MASNNRKPEKFRLLTLSGQAVTHKRQSGVTLIAESILAIDNHSRKLDFSNVRLRNRNRLP